MAILAALLLASAAGWSVVGLSQELPAGVPTKPAAALKPAIQLQGAGSCAAAACHNADLLAGPGRHEYRLAVERDPINPKRSMDRHADAYAVLFEKRSIDIERKLHPSKKNPRPDADALCVRCHVHPAFDPNPRKAPVQRIGGIASFRAEEGVSCEACHGPAQPWLSTHLWAGRSEQLASGQRDTHTLRGRIRVCAGCHVGSPAMDVNHDLIAAGHPRLTFEFSGFHALVHKHWDVAKDLSQPAFETRAWMLGQVVTAQAALELLAYRAEKKTDVWPEFAEHDCAACHHGLEGESKRHERGYPDRKPGTMPQNRWHLAMLGDALEGLGTPIDSKLKEALDGIRRGLELKAPNGKLVAENARRAVTLLNQRLDAVEQLPTDAPALEHRLGQRLSAAGAPRQGSDDDAVQYLLANAALTRARNDPPPPLMGRTMRLLLQIPSDERSATIDPAAYRQLLRELTENKPR
jgi:Cytochrome c554 and c-prime